jgi:predicted ATPase
MSRIRIENFGPIKEGYIDNDGWLDINKVTVFVGNQGSGKSAAAKLIATFTWMEKALVRGDYDKKWFERKNHLKNQRLPYHRLENYLFSNTRIDYQGDVYSIKYKDGLMLTEETANGVYSLPQIMYVPAERNLLTYIKGAKELKLSSEALLEFNTEYSNAKENLTGVMRLPVNDIEIEYNRQFDNLYLKSDNYKIEIKEASSGFQSFVPLYLVSNYLVNSIKPHNNNKDFSVEEQNRFKKEAQAILNNDVLTDKQKRDLLSELASRFNKTSFINIVEEPEQNLFPASQWEMLKSLLEFNNMNAGNKLILTTHSPYLVNFISIAIQADSLKDKIKDGSDSMRKMEKIIPAKSVISADDVAIYQLDENNGAIRKLPDYEGIPSDENSLNQSLRIGNEMFDKLLEIEQEL